MTNYSKVALAGFFLAALLLGVVGAIAGNMYIQHNAQHQAADADHLLLQQLAPVVNQLVQIEQQRQRQQPGRQP